MRVIASAVIVAVAFLTTQCGAPLGPAEKAWVFRAAVPEAYQCVTDAAYADGKLFLVSRVFSRNRIISYSDGVGFAVAFEAPEDVIFMAISVADDAGYAVGATEKGAALAKYEDGIWTMDTQPAINSYDSFTAVAAGADGGCWLIASKPRQHQELIRYDNGAVTEHPLAGRPTLISASGDNVFVYDSAEKTIAVTTDGGATWAREPVRVDLGGGEIIRVKAMTAVGDTLFLALQYNPNGGEYTGVVRRDGAPGHGRYTLVFATPPQGPHFYTISDLSFKSPEDGVAAGYHSSVRVAGDKWQQEETDPYDYSIIVSDPRGGWWAVAKTESLPVDVIYYHP